MIVKLFTKQVAASIQGRGTVVSVVMSGGLQIFPDFANDSMEKSLLYKVLFAFSDYTDPKTNQSIEEIKVNQLDILHAGRD